MVAYLQPFHPKDNNKKFEKLKCLRVHQCPCDHPLYAMGVKEGACARGKKLWVAAVIDDSHFLLQIFSAAKSLNSWSIISLFSECLHKIKSESNENSKTPFHNPPQITKSRNETKLK